VTRKLALYGCGFLLIVVLTHIAEIWQIFPFMGWGQPDSPGHYLALAFAISAAGCFLASFVVDHLPPFVVDHLPCRPARRPPDV
jgi:hypothetical protein